jgi:hypothetical protein
MYQNVDVYFQTFDLMPTELLPNGCNDSFQGQLELSFKLSVSSAMQQDENFWYHGFVSPQ